MTPAPFNSEELLSVLIVDDHKIVRDGLKVMLSSFKQTLRFDIDEADSGEKALRKISRKQYQLVIIDYHMPGLTGAETILRILRYQPDMKILALSNYDELPLVQSMMESGAKGYILKNIEPSQMLLAIKTVLEGKEYYSNEVAMRIIEEVKTGNTTSLGVGKELTNRELEILKLIILELTNEEIAQKLCIAKRTVDSHRQNLLNKLNAKNTVGLIKAAYKLKLVY